jgi:hypothetical protein
MFGGPKVLFVGRCDLGGFPHKELTSWRKSLNFTHHGEKFIKILINDQWKIIIN